MTQISNSRIIHRTRFVDFNNGNITALAFSHSSNVEKRTPSDLRLAVGRSNGNVEIWNPRNSWFQELIIQGGKDRTIEGLVWSTIPGEPLRLFSIGGSTVVTEWDLQSGLPLKNYDCNSGVIWSLSINASQTKLAVGCDNGSVVLIDISGGRGVMEHDVILQRQESRVLTLAWNADNFVIGGCADGRIRVWSVNSDIDLKGRLLHTMKVDKSKKESTLVWSVIYLPATNQIVSGDSTGSVKFWDFHFFTLSQSFKIHDADVLCLSADAIGSKVFSAGVDRKIHQLSLSANSGSKARKWVTSSNRLLHANDVRTLASYQSKGADFLASGGVERTLVISSLTSFADGSYRKFPCVVPFHKNVLINSEQRLCVMWQQSTVKIWKIGGDLENDRNYRLVCKLSLKDEQNICNCAMSPDGQVLLVGRPSTTKIFHLQPIGAKLKVVKLDNDLLINTGCKLAQFVDNSRIVMITPSDDIFTVNLEDEENDEEAHEIKIPEVQESNTSMRLSYLNTINHLVTKGPFAITTRISGAVDLIDLENGSVLPIARLMNFITAVNFSSRDTVILVTADNKIFEFEVSSQGEKSNSTISPWCRKNRDCLPKEFETQKNKCLGIFSDGVQKDKIWFWGSNWLANMDMSQDLPTSARKKPRKHNRDGNTINDRSSFIDDGEEDDEDEEELEITDDVLMKERYHKTSEESRIKKEEKPFFFTEKYRPILFADVISKDEIIVVERPNIVASADLTAYSLPKIRF
ncbi:LAFE_0D07162g1_1 [Lachancea fermentati]|uniref:LAFE_0D07162g1_1 n=1 Tax=Lachancea fermentati TaxID=4955 RepID=A0A1G4MBQ5_LACFM|nr:LAFE_0D07162g1_1 [Lachancea fermentati]